MKKISFVFLTIILLVALELKGNDLPRPEYPRPQFVRSEWMNLNGKWTYTFDFSDSGKEKGFTQSNGFEGEIIVPFCPESVLSGVNYKDFINVMWYQRNFSIPENWKGKNIILHFGAVDYECEVYIDGKFVGKHRGGSSSFKFDITPYVKFGENQSIVVRVKDDVRSGVQPSGKQSPKLKSFGCMYTRTTGIWQTVWIEPVSKYGLESCHIIPDLDHKRFYIKPHFYSLKKGLRFKVTVKEGKKEVSKFEGIASENLICVLPLKKPIPWSPENPFLYDLTFEVIDENEKVIDKVKSYAGLRKIHIEGNRIYLNNSPYYLRFVLDQGFYPDGIWTAPSDSALKRDIELAKKAGFNGARLHQKVFEERFHYWADRLGYLTWAEFPSWGIDFEKSESHRNFLKEWSEVVIRDRNHPSIIAWTPFNEVWEKSEASTRLIIDVYDLTKSLDPTRPVNDSSGGKHIKTDIWTEHTYEQNPEKLREMLSPSKGKPVWVNLPELSCEYGGQPYIIDEYGGIKWISSPDKKYSEESWGYGESPKSLVEFYERLEKLTDVILSLEHISGFCYTQLTDIEQEQNGIYNYDRTEKFDMERIRNIFTKERKQ